MIDSILEQDYTYRKASNWQLIESLLRIGQMERADKVASCGTQLQWCEDFTPPRLIGANFCKDRLCNMCIWRRTQKVYAQVSSVMDVLEERHNYQYVFLTLTVRSCGAMELAQNIDWLFKAFGLFIKDKQVKKAFKGFFRSLEITYHPEHAASIQFHPHLHIIFAVNKSYFRSSYYLDLDTIREIWRHCLEVYYGDISWEPGEDWTPAVGRPRFGTVRKSIGYDPICYIEKVKCKLDDQGEYSLKAAVCEVAKYTVTYESVFGTNSYVDTDRAVLYLSEALHGRRLCAFGGVLRDVARELQLDDAIDGDLVNTDNKKIRLDVGSVISWYNWNVGFGRKVLQESDFEKEDPRGFKDPYHDRLQRVRRSKNPDLVNTLKHRRQAAFAKKREVEFDKKHKPMLEEISKNMEKLYENIRVNQGVYKPLHGATLEADDGTWLHSQLEKSSSAGDRGDMDGC